MKPGTKGLFESWLANVRVYSGAQLGTIAAAYRWRLARRGELISKSRAREVVNGFARGRGVRAIAPFFRSLDKLRGYWPRARKRRALRQICTCIEPDCPGDDDCRAELHELVDDYRCPVHHPEMRRW